ncbi:uncharacterized protein LTR77_001744 [Saxophila tyrrhenica]|uniref:Nuclear speckle splicing regulatory protein 1 N-terminal domain-containing protein n=1 Tax=Saxophila tyrrhenica TaxID=1690608 RepID=A0AAV9PMZ8_9PEZI|nr:hypothetical protein LTR77_001744 [Saxophila tyrrhenica]
MSLKYGLNLKKGGPPPVRKTILDDEDDGEEEEPQTGGAAVEEISTFGSNGRAAPARKPGASLPGAPSPRRKPKEEEEIDRQDLSSAKASKAKVQAAASLDPTIFDYDSFHDAKTSVSEAQKAAAKQDAIDRKPKYINNLLDSAARRKQDQLVAREKLLQKEREAEGDEFKDKEKFVTGAYKEQQAEARRIEEEEERKKAEEEERRRKGGGGMSGFYKGMMEQQEKQHQQALEAAAKMEKDLQEGGVKRSEDSMEKSGAEVAEEARKRGVNVHLNEEGQITDKRALLSAGLNVGSSGKAKDDKGADHLRTSARPAQSAFQNRADGGKQAMRERQSRMMEEQLDAQAKRAREEEEEERQKLEKTAKSAKTEKDVGDAKARYLARKAAKARGES